MLFRDMQIAAGGCTDSIGDECVGAVNLFQISRVETASEEITTRI